MSQRRLWGSGLLSVKSWTIALSIIGGVACVPASAADVDANSRLVLDTIRADLVADQAVFDKVESFSAWFAAGTFDLKTMGAGAEKSAWLFSLLNGKPRAVVFLNGFPVGVFGANQNLGAVAGGVWKNSPEQSWSFHFNGNKLGSFVSPHDGLPGDPPWQFDVRAALGKSVEEDRVKSVSVDVATATTHLTYNEKNYLCTFRRYCPSEQRMTGLKIAEFTLSDPQPGAFVYVQYRAPHAASNDVIGSLPEFDQRLVDGLTGGTDREDIPPNTDDLKLAGSLCWATLLSPRSTSRTREAFQEFMETLDSLPQPTRFEDYGGADELTTATTKFLTQIRSTSVAQSRRRGIPSVVDPGLKWVQFVRQVPPKGVSMVQRRAVLFAISQSNPTPSVRDNVLRFMDALGECGRPDTSLGALLLDIPIMRSRYPIARAGLRARWVLPVDPDDVDLLIETLQSNNEEPISSEMRSFIVETLIRLNRGEDIDDADFDHYWKEEVELASFEKRWSELSEIAQTPTGRQRILEALDSSESQKTVALDATQILVSIARAAVELERWDAISQKECESILNRFSTRAVSE